MTPSELDLAVVIITYNEEPNLGRCIKSLPPNIEIIVVDSGSTDKTTEIAANLGARIFYRKFDDYAQQKNYAVAQAKRRWILSLDADEVLEEGFTDSLNIICDQANDDSIIAYRVMRRLVFLGRTMRYGKSTDWPLRLFRNGKAQFSGAIHEKLVLPEGAQVGLVKSGYLLHYSYDSLEDYFSKFNQYTTKIAERRLATSAGKKANSLQMVRPWFEFFVRYFLKLGFLDGYEGYCYAYLSSVYKFVNYAKLRELQTRNQKIHAR